MSSGNNIEDVKLEISEESETSSPVEQSGVLETLEIEHEIDLEHKQWNMKELKQIPLSSSEKKMMFIDLGESKLERFFIPILLSPFYTCMGIYDTCRFPLIKFCWLEYVLYIFLTVFGNCCLVCFLCLLCVIPIFGPICWFCCIEHCVSSIVELVVGIVYRFGINRISYVEEHRIRGSTESLNWRSGVDSGEEFNLVRFLVRIVTNLCANKAVELVYKIILEKIPNYSCILVIVCFPWGLIFWVIMFCGGRALSYGFDSFRTGYLWNNHKSVFGQIKFFCKYPFQICGYGFASYLLSCIPCFSCYFNPYRGIGATKLGEHLEERRNPNRTVEL